MTTDLFRYYGLDWLWFGTSILAVYLLGNKNKLGFVSMIVSDLTGLAMAYLTQSNATLIGSLIYLVLNVRGWYAWRADEKRIANLRPLSPCIKSLKRPPFWV